MSNLDRVFAALAREGLQLSVATHGYRLRRAGRPDVPDAELLLPPGFALEARALAQLADFAGVHHPQGGRVCRVCATPDFHAGHLVPVGAVIATTTDLVVPQAIGTDINCGMRLHLVTRRHESRVAARSGPCDARRRQSLPRGAGRRGDLRRRAGVRVGHAPRSDRLHDPHRLARRRSTRRHQVDRSRASSLAGRRAPSRRGNLRTARRRCGGLRRGRPHRGELRVPQSPAAPREGPRQPRLAELGIARRRSCTAALRRDASRPERARSRRAWSASRCDPSGWSRRLLRPTNRSHRWSTSRSRRAWARASRGCGRC